MDAQKNRMRELVDYNDFEIVGEYEDGIDSSKEGCLSLMRFCSLLIYDTMHLVETQNETQRSVVRMK